MKSIRLWSFSLLFNMALLVHATANALQKRGFDDVNCYNAGNIIGFGGWCPDLNWPIENNRGLNAMETLYFALASTTVPDDTVYEAGENIICTVDQPGPNITVSLSAQVGGSLISGGGSLTFSLSFPGKDYSLCMFATGIDEANVTNPVTLAQARTLLYELLTAPHSDCKTCGSIPILYPNTTNATATENAGILKIDATYENNCLGKCVGPNSFNTTTAASKSAASRMKLQQTSYGMNWVTSLIALCSLVVLLG